MHIPERGWFMPTSDYMLIYRENHWLRKHIFSIFSSYCNFWDTIYGKIMHIKAYFLSALLFLSSFSGIQAMIIAFTSDMIPRLVYYWSFSVPPYGSHSSHTMKGYINSTLSVFNISDFRNASKPLSSSFGNQTTCRWESITILSQLKNKIAF